MPYTPNMFYNAHPLIFTWKGVLAICTGLITLGALIDFFLKRSKTESILKKVGRWEILLAYYPIRTLQLKVAEFFF